MAEWNPRANDLFLAAVELPDPAARRALLDRECGPDAALRRAVETLLAAHAAAGDFLADPHPAAYLPSPFEGEGGDRRSPGEGNVTHDYPGDGTGSFHPGQTTAQLPPPQDVAGAVIAGRYKLLEQIGEGGMGAVWMADQTEPVKRRVAVKLIRADRGGSKAILARFEAERQAIALMDHPHIAKLLDAGSTAAGEPYFVMELVKGIPLTAYCDTHRLTVTDRLGLFQQICSAVQHAHQKGIIHRDLKPTNILVESHDGKPVPKVIDFGLAKATGGLPLTDHTLFTGFGTVAGTPLYMAPEQATFNAVDIDTRADIYALGVILYELLTGATPIARETFKKAALDEVLRVIREDEPATPSSRISSSDARPAVAASRQTEPARLSRFVRGELDWIVMKALSKDRDRRYETATGFAEDVERFLNHEAVVAGPPTAAYRVRKFVQRNKGRVVAAGLVLLALVGGVIGTSLGLVEARTQRDAADTARLAEADQRQVAEKAAEAERAATEQAKKRLAQVEKGVDLLGSVFNDLDPDGEQKEGRPLRAILADRLGRAAAELDGEAVGDPLTVATLQHHLGGSLHSLGFAAQAVPLVEKARATFEVIRGPDHPETLSSLGSLALAYLSAGRVTEAVPLHEDCLRRKRAVLGPDHPETLSSLNNLALAYEEAGRSRDALPLRVDCLRRRSAVLGPDHPLTLSDLDALAATYQDAGRPAEAVPLHDECYRRKSLKLGPDHRSTLISLNNLAEANRAAGRIPDAIRLSTDCLRRSRAVLGPDHPDTLLSMNNLAAAYLTAGRPAEAVPLLDDGLRMYRLKLGPGHRSTLTCLNNLATAYRDLDRADDAIALQAEALRLSRDHLGPAHPHTLLSLINLAGAYQNAGRPVEAVPLLEECLQRMEVALGPDHPQTIDTSGNMAAAYLAAGQPAKSLPLFERLVSAKRKRIGAGTPEFAGLLAQVSTDLLAAGQFAAAEPYLRECLTIREKAQPDVWTTFNTRSMLGGSLLGQGKPAEAETLLLAGYDGMKARAKTIPPQGRDRLPDAADRLVELYVAVGKPDEVKKWRAERAKYPPPVAPPPRPAK